MQSLQEKISVLAVVRGEYFWAILILHLLYL